MNDPLLKLADTDWFKKHTMKWLGMEIPTEKERKGYSGLTKHGKTKTVQGQQEK